LKNCSEPKGSKEHEQKETKHKLLVKSFSLLTAATLAGAIVQHGVVLGATDPSGLDRTILPVPEPQAPTITELDARNAKAPPRFEVKAPKGAPNVVVVLLDDIGFGQSSVFGGPCKMPTAEKAVGRRPALQ